MRASRLMFRAARMRNCNYTAAKTRCQRGRLPAPSACFGPIFLLCLAGAAASAAAGEKPLSLCRAGGFERLAGWRLAAARVVHEGRPGRCLRVQDRGGAVQSVFIPQARMTLTAAVDVKTRDVRPAPGQRGYAFAAVYQVDDRGRLAAFHDFVQLTGTHDWKRFHFTFATHPRARFVSLRCGLYCARGTAWFDNWTLVQGKTPRRLDEVASAGRRGGPARAAVLREPGMPAFGAASKPETLAAILRRAGVHTEFLSAAQLADPSVFSPTRFDLAALPYGESFPARARLPMIRFLTGGGRLLSTGGYAFNRLIVRQGDQWRGEAEAFRERLAARLAKDRSLLTNGDFEHSPAGSAAGWKCTPGACKVVGDAPRSGRRCARVAAKNAEGGALFWQSLPVANDRSYCVSGWLRTKDVHGLGYAFMALYQYDKCNRLVKAKDFAQERGSRGWTRREYVFAPERGVTHVIVKLGLYHASGTAWFDDVRLNDIGLPAPTPMNTATGAPRDGLVTAPAQMGMFDASFPLKRVRSLRAAPGQHIAAADARLDAALEGWAASGVCGTDQARWVPLLQTYDRYGRPRGAAGAMLMHYAGFYAGSMWTYFGVENVDLFARTDGPLAETLARAAKFMLRGTFLHNLAADQPLYRAGERGRVSVRIANQSAAARRVVVRFLLDGERLAEREIALQADADEEAAAEFLAAPGGPDLRVLSAQLRLDGEVIDEMKTGFVVDRPEIAHAAADSRFVANYFTRGGRPMFLFGSDTYSYTYLTATENPLTWARDHAAARDIGLNVYENLQYSRAPTYALTESDWRAFRAMAQLTQKYNLVFMPGMLIGQNVLIDDARLKRQAALCAEYARRLRDIPALHYYINGDYRAWPAEFPETLWNEWLQRRYGSFRALKAAWGAAAAKGEWGRLPFPPPRSGRWDDPAATDRALFECSLTRRWNETHVAAVRASDRAHPIMSEYYSLAAGALDIRSTIDGQDVADFGFFDRPGKDIDALPLRIRWNDLRARGKGVCLGEYGVKTHPAWKRENGARGYHIQRTEEQQKQLFLAVAHYALGLGASKVQNWCLRDAQSRVFPWGLFYPNQLIPKDVAYAHRNLSVIWRFFRPRYAAPPLTVCLARGMRLGAAPRLGQETALRAFADLLARHYDFNVIDDGHLRESTAAARAMIYPSPFAIDDADYQRLRAWVRAGGALLVTGDLSYDLHRRPTRPQRLEELCGVKLARRLCPHVQRFQARPVQAALDWMGIHRAVLRPCAEVRLVDASALARGRNGWPLLTRRRLGKGQVFWFADPIELDASDEGARVRRALYAAFLRAVGVAPLPVSPDAAWLHVMAQRTERGRVHVVFNTRKERGPAAVELPTAAGRVSLAVRGRWPALAAATDDGRVFVVNAYGRAAVDGRLLMSGSGQHALLSLDGLDLRQSRAMLIGPFDVGRVELPPRPGTYAAVVGEFRGGRWTGLERILLPPGRLVIPIDADRATCMILVCERGSEARWAERLTLAMTRPERLP